MKLASDVQQIDWMVGGICTRSKVRGYGYVIKSNNEEATSNISFVFLYIDLRLHVHTLFFPFFPLLTHQEKEEERERQRVHFEKMKEFMRPREDLECDDHKVSLMCAVELAYLYMCLTLFRTKTPKYLFPRGNKPLLYHQIGNKNFYIYKSVKLDVSVDKI